MTAPAPRVVLLKVNLAPGVAATLRRLAAIKNITYTEAIRQAIGVWNLCITEQLKGNRVEIHNPRSSTYREVEFL